MKNNITGLIISTAFLFVLVCISAGTARNVYRELFNEIKASVATGQLPNMDDLDTKIKDSLFFRTPLIEGTGAVHKLLGRHLSNDMQFYQASDEIMHLKRDENPYEAMIESAYYLSIELEKRSVPFLVCQISERAAYDDYYSQYIDNYSLRYIEPLKKKMLSSGAIYLDYSERFKAAGFLAKDIFLKTDIHYHTAAEFFILGQIISELQSRAGLEFKNRDLVLNLNNYRIEEYPFAGNLTATLGTIYGGTDIFQYYLPTFETSMHLENPSASVIKDGGFESVCMNGYRNLPDPSVRLYRITDYMQWPSPYYTITNNYVDHNRILVIGCSMSMRTTAYLSLLCHEVTVLDPRAFTDKDYLKEALQSDKYDAVIFFPSVNLINGIGGNDAVISSYQLPETISLGNSCEIKVTVKNNGTSTWSEDASYRMCILLDGVDYGYRLYLTKHVAPGESYTFTLPDFKMGESFSAILGFQMIKEGVSFFGERAEVPIFVSVELPQLPRLEMITEQTYGQWMGKHGICLDTCNNRILENGDLTVMPGENVLKIVGWGADFNAEAPFQALYLKVGRNVIRCNYGIDRQSVVDHYRKESLRYTGFETSIPTAYMNNGVSDVSFIAVSADGQYQFQPVKYKIAYLN